MASQPSSLALLLLSLILSATAAIAYRLPVAATPGPAGGAPSPSPSGVAATTVTINSDGSLSFGPGVVRYNFLRNGTVVDSTGATVKPTANADGSFTVGGVYTSYSNGTLTGPGITINTGHNPGVTMGSTTLLLKGGKILDAAGQPIPPTVNDDGSVTAGDMTGWSNGTIKGANGAVLNTGLTLKLNPDGTVGVVFTLALYLDGSISISARATPAPIPTPTTNPGLGGSPSPPAPSASSTVLTINADGSLSFGPGVAQYTLQRNGTVVDSTGAPVTPTANPDGSYTVDGVYTGYPNGTLAGPGIAIHTGDNPGFTIGMTTLLLKGGKILDKAGQPIEPTVNEDGSVTAGDMTGWSNGTIVGSNGAVLNTGMQLTMNSKGVIGVIVSLGGNSDGSIRIASPQATPSSPTPTPGSPTPSTPSPTPSGPKGATTLTFNPDGSLTFDQYTLKPDGSVVDSTGAAVPFTTNSDGSYTVAGLYTAYTNGTLTAPGITITTGASGKSITIGKTTLLADGTIVDAATGTPIQLKVNAADKSVTAGDLTGWENGTIVGSNGAVVHSGLRLTLNADGTISAAPASPSPSPPSPPPSTAPPPPRPAGSLASPATAFTAVITVALGLLLI
ncbi:hypothetical protein CLOM_g17733 [Closterium sp. NIES-68]|nr:hypothetical protein CLOM_g17733 [Closterium sp. NIES-68]GJP83533.1 hypothetical protein CLOP_g13676 [Closterium sp. NIES-67]